MKHYEIINAGSFGSELPANWEEIADRLNAIIDSRIERYARENHVDPDSAEFDRALEDISDAVWNEQWSGDGIPGVPRPYMVNHPAYATESEAEDAPNPGAFWVLWETCEWIRRPGRRWENADPAGETLKVFTGFDTREEARAAARELANAAFPRCEIWHSGASRRASAHCAGIVDVKTGAEDEAVFSDGADFCSAETLDEFCKAQDELRNNLEEITGQESGVVLYPTAGAPEAVICNWSGIDGLPRVFATGLLGLGESLALVSVTEIEGREAFERAYGAPDAWDVIWDVNDDAESFFSTSDRWTVYTVSAANDTPVTVIAPDGWN